ncbi:MAG: nuclear transport factor 2 family protein [Myxococcota bacterium]
MNAKQVGEKLVGYVQKGQNLDAVMDLYADGVISVEAMAPPEGDRIAEGKAAVIAKNEWWIAQHEVHGGSAEGPFPHGEDRFAVIYRFDITHKASKQRMQLEEVGVYQVADGKVIREEYFYG